MKYPASFYNFDYKGLVQTTDVPAIDAHIGFYNFDYKGLVQTYNITPKPKIDKFL